MKKNRTALKIYTFGDIKDKHLGKKGTPKRDQYEYDLKLELMGDLIKTARQERNMTQEQLGKLIGVKKAQISRLERHAKNMTIDTILKVFNALQAKVKLRIELDRNNKLEIV